MSRSQIIRAWKDQEYRESLGEAERTSLPPHPAGAIKDLTDAELGVVVGGRYIPWVPATRVGYGAGGCY